MRHLGFGLCCLGLFFVLGPACGSDAAAPPSKAFGGNGGTSGAGGSAGVSLGGSAGADGSVGGTGGIEIDGSSCSGNQCSGDLHSIVKCNGDVVKACLGTEGCDPITKTCVNACEAAKNAKRSIGCDYYAVFMDALDQNGCFAAFVANTWNQAVKINVEYDGQPLPVENFAYLPAGKGPNLVYLPLGTDLLAPGKVAILFLAGHTGAPAPNNPVCPAPTAVPDGAMLFNQTGRGKAFHITSDAPIVMYQMNPFGGGAAAVSGASLLIPSTAWDTSYLALHAYDAGPQFTSMNIVAREPTTVKILPTKSIAGGGGLNGGPAGLAYSFDLAAGEHAQFTQIDELTGSVIEADKPVGFFAGARCSQVPNNVYACDHLEQMIPPIKALGSEYVGVSHKTRSGEPAFWRVMGVVDGTTLSWSSDVGGPTSVDQGQVVQFYSSFPFVVKSQDSEHPFLLMAHMTGGDTNGMGGVGDADSVLMIPPAQFLNNYVFFADPTYPITNLVVVREKTGGSFWDVTLDCAGGPLTGWKPIGDYEYTRMDLTNGDFQNVGPCSTGARSAKSVGKFGLWVWGWGSPQTASFTSYVSYGYPGGMNVLPINNVTIPIPE
jgi:hypothetical protein